jgi:hypothetical protein
MSRGLIYESQACHLVRSNVSLLTPGRKGDGTNPDPGDTETGLLKLSFDPLGSLKPSIVSRRQLVGVVEQLQQSWIVATGIPRQREDRRRGHRMQFSQDIHCCCPLGRFERITAEQASGVLASAKIVMWRPASENFAAP